MEPHLNTHMYMIDLPLMSMGALHCRGAPPTITKQIDGPDCSRLLSVYDAGVMLPT